MEVSDVRVRLLAGDGKTRAIASVTFDDEFVVHELRVVEGQNGLFVAMPSRKVSDDTYRDIAHPITAEGREKIQGAVLRAFEDAQQRG